MPTKRIEAAFSPPTKLDGPTLADWAELTLLVEERALLSRADLRERLSGSISADESEIDFLLREVRKRAATAPSIYPFRRSGVGIELAPGVNRQLYGYLLTVSSGEASFRRQKRFAKAEFGLDLITQAALRSYLGPASKAVRFAWPASGKRPQRFELAAKWLAEQLGLELGAGRKSPKKKDGGVDVVAWRPFGDKRSGFLVVLAQTTIRTEFAQKSKDIVSAQWSNWITFGVGPTKAIVVPWAIPPNDDRWDDMRYSSHVILDRMRLCELLESGAANDLGLRDGSQLAERIEPWLQDELTALRLEVDPQG